MSVERFEHVFAFSKWKFYFSHELDCVDHNCNGERSHYVCCFLHSPPTLNVIVLRQERACALFLSLNLANITAIEIDTQ